MNSLITKLKKQKNQKLSPVARFLYTKVHISSNISTIISFTFGLVAVFYLNTTNHIFLLFYTLSIIFDILDGAISNIEKKTGKAAKRGVLLDDLSDRAITIFILLKVFYINLNPLILLTSALYILIKGYHIYIKQQQSPGLKLFYFDRIPILFISFFPHTYTIIAISISLIINIFEFLNYKIKNTRKNK